MDEDLKIPEGAEPEGYKKVVRLPKNKSEVFAELMQRKGIRQATAEKEALAKQSKLEADITPEVENTKKYEPRQITKNPAGRESEHVDKELTDEELAATRMKSKGRGKRIMRSILIGAGAILLLGALAGGAFYYNQYRKMKEAVPADEAEAYTAKISKFVVLPNEKPTVATVTDAEKLRSQSFFSSAQNGDKVLLFSNAKKAYLYRPNENKLIEVMTLVESQPQSLPVVTEAGEAELSRPEEKEPVAEENPDVTSEPQKESVKVAVYNGTSVRGLAKLIGEKIAVLEGVSVSEVANAKANYTKTIVIDLTGNNEPFLQNIMNTIGGESGQMPAGETKPEADILIIGGTDRRNY